MKKLLPLFSLALVLLQSCTSQYSEWEKPLPEGEIVPGVELVPDPIERANRMSFYVDDKLMNYLVEPASDGYRYVVPKGARTGIDNFFENILFPRNFLNNLFQADWDGLGRTTDRFILNTTVGILGFRDVAADHYNIKAAKQDTGQSFAKWGWENNFYLYIPILGPSSDRDLVGRVGDYFMNPLIYNDNTKILNYFLIFNKATFFTDAYRSLVETNYDPYDLRRLIYTVTRRYSADPLSFQGEDTSATQTLRAVYLQPREKDFENWKVEGELLVKSTGETIKYNFWLQDKPAPLMYVIPGLGSHRSSGQPMFLAEMAYLKGYNVVTFSNLMNFEPILKSKDAIFPGYTPNDIKNIKKFMGAIDADLEKNHSGQFGDRSVMGISLGAYYLLNLAASETEEDALKFKKYIAIDAPVDLMYGLKQLDNSYNSPLSLETEEERERFVLGTLTKVAAILANSEKITHNQAMPFTDQEAKYLIGLSFRMTLRDMLFISAYQEEIMANNESTPKEGIYKALGQYSWEEYYKMFVMPKLKETGLTEEQIAKDVSLRSVSKALKENDKIRVFTNQNDFLNEEGSIAWMKSTFGDRLTVFPDGGHLGNLIQDKVRSEIIESLED
ncbi:VacJ family lipoprotein [Lentisphaera profundi]|uniref:VacJ family lipoprotein n=1 Tax=Lentisphaera profundi TaxID=1658616 RepID=A0ABY7VYB0_9BACT|nr:VacJ family lipoprotein [Lentisphaera profundi]WDE98707.1 VacJ family lipoprotein [Lentisphaera profundi]